MRNKRQSHFEVSISTEKLNTTHCTKWHKGTVE